MQRREIKKNGRRMMKSHYILLVFLMLIMSLFGSEFTLSTLGWEVFSVFAPKEKKESTEDDPGNILQADNIITANEVYNVIIEGQVDKGLSIADLLSQKMVDDSKTSDILGMTNGVLAQIVNNIGSGRLLARFAKTIRSITKSNTAVRVIFYIGTFLWYALLFTFFRNIYSAVIRRMYLEARTYSDVPFLDVLHFFQVRKFVHACWVMLVEYVCFTLWCLTIVGGFIKYYSYYAVPYIVAENPAIGAKDALKLSRKMMDGHKMELFKFHVTMLGWILLASVTFGISDLFFGSAYRLSCYTEFYTHIRRMAIENGIEGVEALNDPYLFEQADRILLYETYFDVVDEITVLYENRIELTGWRRKAADWFGIWFGSLRKKKLYDEQEGRQFAIARLKKSMAGQAYPQWLNPMWPKRELEKQGNFTYLRNYTGWTLFLLYIVFSFLGWSWEVGYHFLQSGQFANRGTLHGPWLPIYGTGGIIVLLLCSRFRKKPVLEFITAVVLCGVLEYFTGWYLETKYHQRWWSYDGYFLNLHGRICAEGLLIFGVGCCSVVYLFAPVFDYLLSKIRARILIGVAIALGIVYFADVAYSRVHPNVAEGAVEALPSEKTAPPGNRQALETEIEPASE